MNRILTFGGEFPPLDSNNLDFYHDSLSSTGTASPQSLEISPVTEWHPELSFDLSFGDDRELDLRLDDPLEGLKHQFEDGFEKRASAYLSRQAEQRIEDHDNAVEMDWEPSSQQYTLAKEEPLSAEQEDGSTVAVGRHNDNFNANPDSPNSDIDDHASIYSSDWEQYEELPTFNFSRSDANGDSPDYWHDSAVDVSSGSRPDSEYAVDFYFAPSDADSAASEEWSDEAGLGHDSSESEEETLVNVVAPSETVMYGLDQPPDIPQRNCDHSVHNHDWLTVPGESCIEIADRTVMEAVLARLEQPTSPLHIEKQNDHDRKSYSWEDICTNINAITKSIEQWEQRRKQQLREHQQQLLQQQQQLQLQQEERSKSPPLETRPFIGSPQFYETESLFQHSPRVRKESTVEPLAEEEAIDDAVLHDLGVSMDSKPPQVRDSIICGTKGFSLDEMDDCIGDDEHWRPVLLTSSERPAAQQHSKSRSMSMGAFSHRPTRHRVLGSKLIRTVKF